jgi:hypothetical protein
LPEFEIKDKKELKNFKHVSFYTDVQHLNKVVMSIFEGIRIRPEHNQIGLFLNNENLFYELKIVHFNSFSDNKSIEDSKFRCESGDFGTIKNRLINLGDWSIESKFREGCYRINYLSSNEVDGFEEINECLGFTHILRFYKL